MAKIRNGMAVLLVFALVAVACGDDEETPETTAATTAATTTATTAATTTEAMMDDDEMMDGDEMMDIATDVGVDLEEGVIKIGLLSDLTGPFGALVTPIVTGQEVYWEDVNARGGIQGLRVELEVVDTEYVVDNHIQLYEEIKDQVVAIGHSTGSPHTVAINEDLQDDGIFAIPLTWYSGWSDPAINSNLVPHGIPYCLEAMNSIEYIAKDIGASTIAIASLPGDYGLDSAAGAALAAEALGLEVVYDGSGAIIPGEDLTPIADAIVESGADMVFVTATPGAFSAVYGAAIAQGFEAKWSGALPSWNPAFISEDSAIRDAIERDFVASSYLGLWSSDGAAQVRDLMNTYRPDSVPHDFYGEGILEAIIMHQALQRAYENGDMTQAGVLRAAKSLGNVDFDGLAPSENYAEIDPSVGVQRTSAVIFKPSQADLAAGGTGVEVLETNYVSDIARDFDFQRACYSL